MLESDVNRWIANSLDWGYKIPDPPKAVALRSSPRPFDGMGFLLRDPDGLLTVCWEAKFQRSYSAFNFGDIRPHQLENLARIQSLSGLLDSQARVLPVIALGVHWGRGISLFLFHIDWIARQQARGRKSVLGKELLQLEAEGRCLKSFKQLFDFHREDFMRCVVVEDWE